MASSAPIVVAGHVCLDIIPAFPPRAAASLGELLKPGSLVQVGAATISTGGAVANVGVALHRLGVAVRLAGKVGADAFGDAVRGVLESAGKGLSEGMTRRGDVATSYTVVVNPPGVDRVFLHCPGANDTFDVDDLPDAVLHGSALLYFGYPPLMRSVYSDGGERMRAIFERARALGVATSLDMSQPDPESDAGRVDWRAWLTRVLPAVDLFLPSYDELLLMLERPRFEAMRRNEEVETPDPAVLKGLADELIARGAAVVAIKLGSAGLYLQTTGDRERLRAVMGLVGDVDRWRGRRLYAPCFEVELVGTTGSGDCTIAGFLAGLVRGAGPEEVVRGAVAVGACNVEAADATSGVWAWGEVAARIASGWRSRPASGAFAGWAEAGPAGVRRGPGDGD